MSNVPRHFVVAGVIERETERLALIEEQAIQLRVVLRAASNLWFDHQPVPVGETANTLLNSWPYDHEDPTGLRMKLMEDRQAPFARLHEQLCDGMIDADISWEVVSPTH